MNPRIGIIGAGMVGGTLKGWFTDAKIWDKYKKTPDKREEVLEQDIIFICIYLEKNGMDEKEFKTVCEILDDVLPNRIIINKMTTVPGFTDRLAEKYPRLKFFHNPEFLTEASSDKDFRNPPFQILGHTGNVDDALMLFNLLPASMITRVISAKESELFKMVRNAFLASKVVLANQVYDLCQKIDVRYDALADLFKFDQWIGGSHTQIWHKGYRGYGGKCLPKDIHLLMEFSKKNNVRQKVFETIERVNKELQ